MMKLRYNVPLTERNIENNKELESVEGNLLPS